MRLEDMRASDNVEDRRGMGVGRTGAGFGLGTIVVLVAGYFLGVNPSTLLGLVGDQSSGQVPQGTGVKGRPTDAQGEFAARVLGETEDVWGRYFAAAGQRYTPPTMVLYTDEVASACGTASSAAGPFYCPGDQQLYIDLGFFNQLATEFGAPGDFARAYVIAHEVGHHIQTLLGITDKVDRLRAEQGGGASAHGVQVEVELQADCFAGVWAKLDQRIIEPGEVKQALQAAASVGDDTLQRRMQGRVVPETFTHGSAEQRQRWFGRGFESGRIESCDTYSAGAQL
jgi:predicted metalloprotease